MNKFVNFGNRNAFEKSNDIIKKINYILLNNVCITLKIFLTKLNFYKINHIQDKYEFKITVNCVIGIHAEWELAQYILYSNIDQVVVQQNVNTENSQLRRKKKTKQNLMLWLSNLTAQ